MQSVKELTPLEYYDTSFKPGYSDCNIFIKQPNVTVLFLINHLKKRQKVKHFILPIHGVYSCLKWFICGQKFPYMGREQCTTTGIYFKFSHS